MPDENRCRFCAATPRTAQGLRSHYAQRPSCRRQLELVLQVAAEHAALYQDAPPSPAMEPEPFDELEAMDLDAPEDNPAPPVPRNDIDRRARVDEVPDKDDFDLDAPGSARWGEDYPEAAGCVLDDGATGQTDFEALQEQQEALGLAPWAPFESEGEWELGRWLLEAGVSRAKIDEFLRLKKITSDVQPSFHNAYSFYAKIDSLPTGPKWGCEMLTIVGDTKDGDGKPIVEELEFWRRDALECIKDLMANPAFNKHMHYAPEHVYRDEACTNREYSEMYTADRWWELQGKIPIGHTVCPVIIGTDETQLSTFSGDKKAWPAYLTIGNIDTDIRRKPTSHAMVLIGYIPVSKFHCFSNAKRRSSARYQLFHDCMRTLLAGLKEAGKDGVKMLCADKHFRQNHPILAGYIADHPERCLVSCCAENRCTDCKVREEKRGDPIYSPPRDPVETIKILRKEADGLDPPQFDELGLRLIDPFWKDLPHCNIFRSFFPDLLHQMHKGAFDHARSWATASLGGSANENEAEIDKRFQAMVDHPSLRHFRQGISLVSQWTGNEAKEMEKVFLGVLNGAADAQVTLAVRGVLDFIYYAHFETHTDASLAKLEAAWRMFHDNKKVFVTMGIRAHFNIPKIHAMQHYVDLIRAGGSTGGHSTELQERMHIDCAKLGYRASNHKDYISQMTVWLTRREAVHRFSAYLQWATPRYIARVNQLKLSASDSSAVTAPGVPQAAAASTPASSAPAPTPSPKEPVPPFKIAKSPPFHVSPDVLEAEFGAHNFLYHLETFLRSESIFPDDFNSIRVDFPIYKRVTVVIPPVVQVSKLPIHDPIRATCAVPSVGRKKAVPPRFDTILARKQKPPGPVKRLSLDGLFAGRIRAIFALPIEYGRYETPLAYIEWFTPLTRRDDVLGMFKVSAASHNQHRRASIIPVTLINRSCHLIPQLARKITSDLTSETVLDRAKAFYLNPYLRHIDFVLLRGVE
ncbi:hypothetical protein C8F01DRAFT_1286849 [Mycena amicta]|nr:hypothetical protein C8F01DRAFT_1286849 [Mycena amicta]